MTPLHSQEDRLVVGFSASCSAMDDGEDPWECSSSSMQDGCCGDDSFEGVSQRRRLPVWRRHRGRRLPRKREELFGRRTRSFTTGDVQSESDSQVVEDQPQKNKRREKVRRRPSLNSPPSLLQESFTVVEDSSSNPEWWETGEEDVCKETPKENSSTQSSTDSASSDRSESSSSSSSILLHPLQRTVLLLVLHSFLDVLLFMLSTAFTVLEASVVLLVQNNRLLRWTGQGVVSIAAHAVRCAGYSPKEQQLKEEEPKRNKSSERPRLTTRWRFRRAAQQQEIALRRKRLIKREI